MKASRIRQLSKGVLDEYGGDLSQILGLSREEAKERLMELPGIGDKTADVLLTTRYSYREVIPVDTHMERLAKRLGLVDRDAVTMRRRGRSSHSSPRRLGRGRPASSGLLAKHTCKARRPRCHECPIIELCDYGQKS